MRFLVDRFSVDIRQQSFVSAW